MLVGLSLVTGLAGRSLVLALISAVLGLLIAHGRHRSRSPGAPRFTFGRLELLAGIDVVIVAMGLFGVGEILAEPRARGAARSAIGDAAARRCS